MLTSCVPLFPHQSLLAEALHCGLQSAIALWLQQSVTFICNFSCSMKHEATEIENNGCAFAY